MQDSSKYIFDNYPSSENQERGPLFKRITKAWHLFLRANDLARKQKFFEDMNILKNETRYHELLTLCILLSRLLIRDKDERFREEVMNYAVDNNLGFVFEDSEVQFLLRKKFYGEDYTSDVDGIQDTLICLIDSLWHFFYYFCNPQKRRRCPGNCLFQRTLTSSYLDVLVSLHIFLGDPDFGDRTFFFLCRKQWQQVLL